MKIPVYSCRACATAGWVVESDFGAKRYPINMNIKVRGKFYPTFKSFCKSTGEVNGGYVGGRWVKVT